MTSIAGRQARVRWLAWACAALVLAITTLSAYIRLSRVEANCEPAPQCIALAAADPAGPLAAARIAHRIAASTALLLIVAMLITAYASQPTLRVQGRLVLWLLGLALFLAVLGRMAGDSLAPAVVAGNLAGGIALFALSVRLALASAPPVHRAPRSARWPAGPVAAVAVVTVALGAIAAGANGPSSCAASAGCATHAAAAFVFIVAVLALCAVAWRSGERRAAGAVALLALAATGIAVLLLFAHGGLPHTLAHNASAAVLLASLSLLLPSRQT